MTNKELQRLFEEYNERFFDGRLSGVIVKFEKLRKYDGLYRFRGEIAVHKSLRSHPELAKIVLLHEMVHADLMKGGYIGHTEDTGHGTHFHVGIDRLYKVGAYEGLL